MHPNVHIHGWRAARPGWKQIQCLAKWADHQGDPGRSCLELPSLTWGLNIVMLPSVGGERKKAMSFYCVSLMYGMCFVWGFA